MKLIFALLISGLLFKSLQGQTEVLPKPTGKYLTGVTYLSFIDNDRKELFDNNLKSSREITVKAWYPSDTSLLPEPYLLKAEAEFAVKHLQFPELFKVLKTNSSRDVPLSSGEDTYPVLIFSHGFGEHYSQNSILMEELASHGYIVFSISHHYECKFSSYPDGRLISIDMNSLRFQNIIREMSDPKAMEWYEKMFSAKDDKERMQVFAETRKLLPTSLIGSAGNWAEDISFFMDQLEVLNREDKIFRGKLNPGRTGVFGMSLGGIASGEISLSDKRIKACINIDGGFFGAASEKEIQVPTMFLNSKRFLGYGKIFTGRSGTDCYSFSTRESDHYNFSDYSIYPVPSVRNLLGTIEGTKTIEIMNVMVLAFFNKYLKGNGDINLTEQAAKYPEIETATNIE